MSRGHPEQPKPSALIALVASSTALAALGIAALLPALPEIGTQMHVEVQNHLQWLISSYFLGLGLCQLLFGVLSDSSGHKRVLVGGVVAPSSPFKQRRSPRWGSRAPIYRPAPWKTSTESPAPPHRCEA